VVVAPLTLLASAAAGIQPDSITIAPNGQHAVAANEAEGTGIGNNGGDGSSRIAARSTVCVVGQ
jgi:hypothetical protein